jgi:hypothetical protein
VHHLMFNAHATGEVFIPGGVHLVCEHVPNLSSGACTELQPHHDLYQEGANFGLWDRIAEVQASSAVARPLRVPEDS